MNSRDTGTPPIQSSLSRREASLGLVGDSQVVIDKTRHHAHFAWVLARIHPQSVFIDQRRDVRGILASIHLQAFKPIFGYRRSVQSIADDLVRQRRRIERWHDAGLPVFVYDLKVFVRAMNVCGRVLIAKLGDAWSDAYVANDKRVAGVRNFNTSSVRERTSKAYTNELSLYKNVVGD